MFLPVSDQPQNVLFNQLSNFEYLESLTPAPSPHKLTRLTRTEPSLLHSVIYWHARRRGFNGRERWTLAALRAAPTDFGLFVGSSLSFGGSSTLPVSLRRNWWRKSR